jgi:hypothetical protein
MAEQLIMPEHLHKDELQYELEARGLSTEGLNVPALRSLFRTSRDLKQNSEVLTASERFKDPASIFSFCHDRFNQIKDLVDNTDSSRVSIDFPRYMHRLTHLVTRLQHLFQFAKLGADMRLSVTDFQEQLQRLMAEVADKLRTVEHIQPVQGSSADTFPPPVSGRPEPLPNSSDYCLGDNSGRPDFTIAAPPYQHPSLIRDDPGQPASSNGSPATPFVFAKMPNPVHSVFTNLAVTDGLQPDNLINLLRIVVRIKSVAPAFGLSNTQVLQILYGYTKGPLASKTMVAMQRGYTLDAYHDDVLVAFIPPRLKLRLLNSLYYRPQAAEEHLSDYVTDIKEIAAVFRQDTDEGMVVNTILDGLNLSERNRLVFVDKPRNYAELDKMCIYAHNNSMQVSDAFPRFLPRRPVPPSVREPGSSNLPVRSPVVCYRCNRPGHTRRTCRVQESTVNTPPIHPNEDRR